MSSLMIRATWPSLVCLFACSGCAEAFDDETDELGPRRVRDRRIEEARADAARPHDAAQDPGWSATADASDEPADAHVRDPDAEADDPETPVPDALPVDDPADASPPPPPQPPPPEEPLPAGLELGGVWSGRYMCEQGPTALTLTLVHDAAAGFLEAEFAFEGLPENQAVSPGRFSMVGAFELDSGRVTLDPLAWLDQPADYDLVGLRGEYDPATDRISGLVVHPACAGFAIVRE